MRLIGAALLTAAGLLAGLAVTGSLRARVDRLRELCRMLELMEFELGRFRRPLPELFEGIAARTDGEAAALCRRMGQGLESLGERDLFAIWTEAIQPLPPKERTLLLPLGQVLGRYGAEEQLQAVAACRATAAEALEEARTAVREKGRMWTGLAAAGGGLLSVLLL